MTPKRRLGWVAVSTAAGVMTIGATAFADGDKEGCAKKAEARFDKSDSNSDGFLTAAEAGEKKWAHIKVADANSDSKVSKAEINQAKADGKLKHEGKGNKKGKN